MEKHLRLLFFVTAIVCYAVMEAILIGSFVVMARSFIPIGLIAAVVIWPIIVIIALAAIQLIAYEYFDRRVFAWLPNSAIGAPFEAKFLSVIAIWAAIGVLGYLYITAR